MSALFNLRTIVFNVGTVRNMESKKLETITVYKSINNERLAEMRPAVVPG